MINRVRERTGVFLQEGAGQATTLPRPAGGAVPVTEVLFQLSQVSG